MNNNISFLKFNQVKLPSMKEVTNKDYIQFGEDNSFPDYILNLMRRSALHNAILVSKVEAIVGNGLIYDKENNEEDLTTEAWLNTPNPYENQDSILRKISYDLEMYGGFYLNLIGRKDKKGFAEMYHVDFSKIRSGKQNDKGQVELFYYCEDWSKYKKIGTKEIVAYDKNKIQAEQLLFVKPYVPGQTYYPLPPYVGALAYIEIDTEISNFHLAHIKNGMNPSIIVTFTNGEPIDEEKRIIERKIEQKFSSTDNAGRFMLMFADGPEKAPIVTTVSPSQLDKQFIQLQATVLQNILSGHRITSPMLVGIKTEGQLGGATELQNAYQIYQKTVIEPHQKIVLETLNKIGAINGCKELKIEPMTPIEFMWSENILSEIMTKDEMREKIGMEPLEVTVVEPIIPTE